MMKRRQFYTKKELNKETKMKYTGHFIGHNKSEKPMRDHFVKGTQIHAVHSLQPNDRRKMVNCKNMRAFVIILIKIDIEGIFFL